MNPLTFLLLSDGTSNQILMPILVWLLGHHVGPDYP